MVQCPSCKMEVTSAHKGWSVPSELGEGNGERARQFCTGIFECPNCKFTFKSQVDSTSESKGTVKTLSLIERVNSIREGLNQSLKTLRIKIEALETERSSLLAEAEELKKAAEFRANALEAEVNQLREDIRSLRGALTQV